MLLMFKLQESAHFLPIQYCTQIKRHNWNLPNIGFNYFINLVVTILCFVSFYKISQVKKVNYELMRKVKQVSSTVEVQFIVPLCARAISEDI